MQAILPGPLTRPSAMRRPPSVLPDPLGPSSSVLILTAVRVARRKVNIGMEWKGERADAASASLRLSPPHARGGRVLVGDCANTLPGRRGRSVGIGARIRFG